MNVLPELFEPLRIGPMTVANRLGMSGMSAGVFADERGDVSEDTIAYFVERARSAPGMITIGASAVVPHTGDLSKLGRSGSAGMRLYAESMLPSLRRLVGAVHAYDTRIGIQLFNAGGTGRGAMALISPSGLSSNVREAREPDKPRVPQNNRALALDEIPGIVECFASAAERCQRAGFDFVELHAGHGYLISNFMTPLFNRRNDRYGGSFDNRVRFLLEIVAAVKARVGARTAVGVKYNGDDFIGDEGWTLADSMRLAPLLEAAGADYLALTAGLVGAPRLTIPPLYEPQGCYVELAAAVKPLVRIPVGTVGRIKHPRMARDLIVQGKVDFVLMGRPFIADPEIVGKTREGRLADIRPCLADCRGCADEHILRGGRASCVVNPRMGRERDLVDIPLACRDRPKKVLVVGGGLAGMEAARRCAFSGHHVSLVERRAQLGGQICLAAMIPERGELADIVPWYERQLQLLGVSVQCSTAADAALLQRLGPDVLIVATGSVPQVPQHLLDAVLQVESVDVMLLDELLEQGLEPGTSVLVVGGDQNGVLVADRLAQAGRAVWIAEASSHFGAKLAGHDRWYLFNRLEARGVRRIKQVSGIEVGAGDVLTLVQGERRLQLPRIDTIVFAGERRADRSLVEAGERLGIDTRIVGDAFDATSETSGTIFATIARAYDVARAV